MRDGQRLSTFEWSFRASALWAGPQTLYLSGPNHIHRKLSGLHRRPFKARANQRENKGRHSSFLLWS